MNLVTNRAIHTASQVLLPVMFFLLHVTLVPVEGQNTFKFDCRRSSNSCGEQQAKCNVGTGKCECDNALTNPTYNCKVPQTSVPCAVPSSRITYLPKKTDAANGVCAEENLYGDGCEMKRVQIYCSFEKMFIAVNPHSPFTGTIYVFGKSDTEACKLTQLTDTSSLESYIENKDALQGYSLELTHTNVDCGDANDREQTDDDGNKEDVKTRTFFIQYNSAFRTSLDQLISADCIISKDGVKVHSNIQSVKQESESDFDNVDASGSVDVVTLTITDADGQAIGSEIALGTGIKLVFTMSISTNFKTFTLASCSANNTLEQDDTNYNSIEFVKNSCPTALATALFRGGIQKDEEESSVTMEINLSAFMFAGSSSNVAFGCTLKLCNDATKSDCAEPSQCAGLSIPENGDNVPDTNGDNVPDTNGDNVPDTNGDIVPDTNGDIVPDTNGDIVPDTNGDIVPDTNGDNVPDTNGDIVPDPNGDNVPDTNGDIGPDPNSDNVPDTNGDIGPDTNGDIGSNTVGNNDNDSGRRKRDVASSEKVSTVITVYDPLNKISELQEVIESNDCIQQPEIIAVIVILGLSVVLLMVLSIILVLRMMRSRQKVGVLKSNQVQNFAIPRLEMTGGSRYSC